jgi:hypothetical protein
MPCRLSKKRVEFILSEFFERILTRSDHFDPKRRLSSSIEHSR